MKLSGEWCVLGGVLLQPGLLQHGHQQAGRGGPVSHRDVGHQCYEVVIPINIFVLLYSSAVQFKCRPGSNISTSSSEVSTTTRWKYISHIQQFQGSFLLASFLWPLLTYRKVLVQAACMCLNASVKGLAITGPNTLTWD